MEAYELPREKLFLVANEEFDEMATSLQWRRGRRSMASLCCTQLRVGSRRAPRFEPIVRLWNRVRHGRILFVWLKEGELRWEPGKHRLGARRL